MSVAVQAHQTPETFGVDAAQFEEITTPKDKRLAHTKHSSSRRMEKGSDSESYSNKERSKNTPKKNSKDYYSSQEESYDDDFESDPDDYQRKSLAKNTARKSPSPKRNLSRNNSRSPDTTRTKSPSVISPRSNKKGKGKRRFKPYESPRSSSPATSRLPPEKNWAKPKNRSANAKSSRIDHTVVDRVLSANRHKVTKLESRLSQLIQELSKEREENKTLRLIQHRQEKKLEKVIGEEAELPQLLVKHTAEVKSLRERIRRLQDSSHQKDEKIGEQDKAILKLKDRCKYYRDLCEKEELTEKAELEKNLLKAQDALKKRDEEISKLQRMMNLKEKTHSRNMKEHREKLRETQEKLRLMEENASNLQGKLRVREKQLDYTNIYQRQIVLKEKGLMPPDSPPRMAALPAPKRTKAKGIQYATKIKGNKANNNSGDNKKENTVFSTKDSSDESNKKPNSVFLTAQSDKESGSDRDINKNEEANNDKELLSITDGKDNNVENNSKNLADGVSGTSEDELNNSDKRRKEDFEKSLREEDERLRKQKEEVERKLKEIQEREEREKAEREAKWREDSARRAREAEERRVESARKREEEKRKNEERIAEERRREEERKKEEKRREQEKKAYHKEDSFFEDEESRRKKDALLARLKAIDNDKASDEDPIKVENKQSPRGDDFWKPQASKSYEARKADQNLHNGLPAVSRESRVFSPSEKNKVISPPESVKSDPDGVFGVPRNKPVLLGRGGLTKKKDNQFSWLDDNKKPTANKAKPDDSFNFGDYSPSMGDSKKKSDDILDNGLSKRAGHGRRREGGFGDDGFDFGDRRGADKPKPQNNSLAFLSDDYGSKRGGEKSSGGPGSNSPLLPRRRAAQERSGPMAISSAFDDNLDDLEEFTL